jgi:hypothetical protein
MPMAIAAWLQQPYPKPHSDRTHQNAEYQNLERIERGRTLGFHVRQANADSR